MSVLLIPNPTKDEGLAVTRRAAQILRQGGQTVLMPDTLQSGHPLPGVVYLPEAAAYAEADRVVTVGGDGTLLRAGKTCARLGLPVLGVNLGRTGFLATCEVAELEEKLRRLAAEEFSVSPRLMLKAETESWQAEAVNDVVIFGHSRLHPMDYRVLCDGTPVGHYRSDGLIFATPTGSTAYSFSAGGPVLDADAPVLVLTPVCSHDAGAAPIVFGRGRTLEVTADADNRDLCYACADSDARCDLHPGETLRITAAENTLKLVSFAKAEQFDALANKLMRR